MNPVLRQFRSLDAVAVLDAFDDPGMASQGEVADLDQAAAWIAAMTAGGPDRHVFAVDVAGTAVGAVGVTAIDRVNLTGWFWYWLHRGHRGRGTASSAAATVATWALGPSGLVRLELGHRANNPASGVVARNAGFIREGVERGKFIVAEQRVDVWTYGRLLTDPSPTTKVLEFRE